MLFRSPIVVGRFLLLLRELNRPFEVEALARRMASDPGQWTDAGEVRLASMLAVEAGNDKVALKLARRCVDLSPTFHNELWLGRLLSQLKQPKAEETIRRAISLNSSDGAGWIALVEHLEGAGRHMQAVATVAEAEMSLGPAHLPLSLDRKSVV